MFCRYIKTLVKRVLIENLRSCTLGGITASLQILRIQGLQSLLDCYKNELKLFGIFLKYFYLAIHSCVITCSPINKQMFSLPSYSFPRPPINAGSGKASDNMTRINWLIFLSDKVYKHFVHDIFKFKKPLQVIYVYKCVCSHKNIWYLVFDTEKLLNITCEGVYPDMRKAE